MSKLKIVSRSKPPAVKPGRAAKPASTQHLSPAMAARIRAKASQILGEN